VVQTDETLLRQLRQGDKAAFDTLFLRHYERVYRVVYNLVGSREEAEDLVQETFITLYSHPPSSVRDHDNEQGTQHYLAAWLCRVALNRGYNLLRGNQRSQKRMERVLDYHETMGGYSHNAYADEPYSAAVRTEERAYVRSLLAQLPERQSNLLLLRYAGFSYAEIAAILGVAQGSVGTLLARAERAFLALSQATVVS
jgi:RNA polymerase sigma-70 factor (ECF subfamily)